MDTMIEQEVDGSTAASLLENPKPRLTLRDAVRLCGMSEKTLRRKLEAGLLNGFRENLDYGGFMWMIDARSLADLYPDSAQLRDYIRLLEFQLNQRPTPPTASTAVVSPSAETPAGETPRPAPQEAVAESKAQEPPAEEAQEPRQSREKPKNNDFVIYLLEENRCLKEDLREKEIRLRQLQDRSMLLERECGEQRGTASTQARVLDWFQRQPQTALPPGPGEVAPLTAPPEAPTSPPPVRPALLGALAASLVIWLIMAITHLH